MGAHARLVDWTVDIIWIFGQSCNPPEFNSLTQDSNNERFRPPTSRFQGLFTPVGCRRFSRLGQLSFTANPSTASRTSKSPTSSESITPTVLKTPAPQSTTECCKAAPGQKPWSRKATPNYPNPPASIEEVTCRVTNHISLHPLKYPLRKHADRPSQT